MIASATMATHLSVFAPYDYWTDAPSVTEGPMAGGPTKTLAAGQSPTSIAVDDRYVYWTSLGTTGVDGTVARVAK
jgi:hypothetical protein